MNILLVGCGKMGGALLSRWRELGLYTDIRIVEPSGEAGPVTSRAELPEDFFPDIVVFAVKPQVLDETLDDYRSFSDDGALILSIAAGKPIALFEKHFGDEAKIVRCMPNLPASVGHGMTVACANENVSPYEKDNAETLIRAVGAFLWANEERLLDPVTALSGSGPAYVFLLIEALAAAGTRIGLDPVMAMTLARETLIGSAALVQHAPDIPAARLRENVTSPGGTTAAALEILMQEKGGLQDLLTRAITAANDRAKELAQS